MFPLGLLLGNAVGVRGETDGERSESLPVLRGKQPLSHEPAGADQAWHGNISGLPEPEPGPRPDDDEHGQQQPGQAGQAVQQWVGAVVGARELGPQAFAEYLFPGFARGKRSELLPGQPVREHVRTETASQAGRLRFQLVGECLEHRQYMRLAVRPGKGRRSRVPAAFRRQVEIGARDHRRRGPAYALAHLGEPGAAVRAGDQAYQWRRPASRGIDGEGVEQGENSAYAVKKRNHDSPVSFPWSALCHVAHRIPVPARPGPADRPCRFGGGRRCGETVARFLTGRLSSGGWAPASGVLCRASRFQASDGCSTSVLILFFWLGRPVSGSRGCSGTAGGYAAR